MSIKEALKEAQIILKDDPNPEATSEPEVEEVVEPTPEPEEPAETAEKEQIEEVKQSKYKTLEEAEKAAKEAEKRMHAATQEAAELRKQLTELLEREQSAMAASAKEHLAKKIAGTLKEISGLDATENGYEEKAAEMWANLLNETVDLIAESKIKSTISKQMSEYEKKLALKSEFDSYYNKALKTAADAGLDMQENSPDYILFWNIAQNAKEGSFKEQLDWAIAETKKVKEGYLKSYAKSMKTKDAKLMQPLERFSELKQEVETPETPISISGALKAVRRQL